MGGKAQKRGGGKVQNNWGGGRGGKGGGGKLFAGCKLIGALAPNQCHIITKLIGALAPNQCHIITFLTSKTDNIAKLRIELKSSRDTFK